MNDKIREAVYLNIHSGMKGAKTDCYILFNIGVNNSIYW